MAVWGSWVVLVGCVALYVFILEVGDCSAIVVYFNLSPTLACGLLDLEFHNKTATRASFL